jgi:3-hydroxy acid dehydrogenase/malonic semialdehyde reductase
MAESLRDKVVFVTGASAGIGKACARAFAAEGARLLLLARRVERLRALAPALRDAGAGEVHVIGADVRDAAAVSRAVDDLPAAFAGIDVLVNNAGLSRGLDPLHRGSLEDWNEMIDTNVKGLLHVDRAVIPGMVERGRGTVIHVGSIAGRQVYPSGNVYCATKHAVRAITEGLRLDLLGTGVRVVTVDPGLLRSEFGLVRFRGDAAKAEAAYAGMTPLTPEDVAEVVLFAATRPPHVNLAEAVVLPTDQGSTVHVHRRR